MHLDFVPFKILAKKSRFGTWEKHNFLQTEAVTPPSFRQWDAELKFPKRGESMCLEGVMVGMCLWQTQQRKQTTSMCMHQEQQHQGDHWPSPRGASTDIQLQAYMAASVCTEAIMGFWPPSHLVPFPLLSRDRFNHHTSKKAVLLLLNWYLHLSQITTHILHINLLITSNHLEKGLKSIFSEILLGFFYSR